MVDDRVNKPSTVKRQKTARPHATRARRTATRPLVLPRPSAIYEAQTGSINRSLGQQLQERQAEQNRQVDINLFRQEIRRGVDSPALGCSPGSLRC
jgi:hypothetical protein